MYCYFNDRLCPGNRRPRLYLAKGAEVKKFEGVNIPDFCIITAHSNSDDGTAYDLDLSTEVRPLLFLSPMHSIWGENFSSWEDLAECLELPVEVAKQIIRTEYPTTANRLGD